MADRCITGTNIVLPAPPTPLGAYVEAVQTGDLLMLSGMLPVAGGEPVYAGRIGAELSIEDGFEAAALAALNGLAVVRQHLGSLERVARVVRLGVYIAAVSGFREHPRVADGASEVLDRCFGEGKRPVRVVYGVASIPLGVPVEVEATFEIAPL